MEIKLTFLGDVMCDYNMSRTLEMYRHDGKYNFDDVFIHVKSLLNKSDYVMANLETPISKDDSKLTNAMWEFCSPFEFAESIKNSGVDFVSTCNNHCLDRGVEGAFETIDCLDSINIDHTGLFRNQDERTPLIVKVKNRKIGIMAYTYGTNAVSNKKYTGFKRRKIVNLLQEQEGAIDLYDPIGRYANRHPNSIIFKIRRKVFSLIWPDNVGKEWVEHRTIGVYRRFLIRKDIKYLKKKNVDLTIVYVHVGGQYNVAPNNYTKYITKWFEKRGVNFIIGNHEHVIHGHEFSKNHKQLTTFALGNFIGSAGVIRNPMGRRSEYSIAVHAYIGSNCKINKVTFSVLKTILSENGKFEVWPVVDLLNALHGSERESLYREARLAIKDFLGKSHEMMTDEIVLFES